jgi:hypothetical protein
MSNTADDREFSQWHRVASENLLHATTTDTRIVEYLDSAHDYGYRALGCAANTREFALALGLLNTVNAVRTIERLGLQFSPSPVSADRR